VTHRRTIIQNDLLNLTRSLNTNWHDIEIAGLISSIFAYGNIKQIISSLENIFQILENQPYEFVMNYHPQKDDRKFEKLKHRFYTHEDIAALFFILNKVYNSYGSLNYLFLLYYFENDTNLKNSLSFFTNNLLDIAASNGKVTPGIKFMFPDPLKGSACKRMNLFLRWMIRKDDLDFGLWKEIKPNKLLIPVSTIYSALSLSINRNLDHLFLSSI